MSLYENLRFSSVQNDLNCNTLFKVICVFIKSIKNPSIVSGKNLTESVLGFGGIGQSSLLSNF